MDEPSSTIIGLLIFIPPKIRGGGGGGLWTVWTVISAYTSFLFIQFSYQFAFLSQAVFSPKIDDTVQRQKHQTYSVIYVITNVTLSFWHSLLLLILYLSQ